MENVATILDATTISRRILTATERVLHSPATTARLIPGSYAAYATGVKKPTRSVACAEPFHATHQPSRSPSAIAKFVPAFFWHLSPQMLAAMLVDACLLCVPCLVARTFFGGGLESGAAVTYLCLFLAAGMQESLYGKSQNNNTGQFLLAKTSGLASLATVLLLHRTARGVATVTLFSITSFGLMSGARWIWKNAKGAGSDLSRNVLLVGEPSKMQAVAAALRSDGCSRCVQWQFPDGQLYEVHGADALRNLTREKHIDEVVIASHDPTIVRIALSECRRNALDVLIVPDIPEGGVSEVENIAGIPLLKVREQHVPEWSLAFKRIIDAVLASFGLALVFPLMCLIAVAIRVDSRGPILYRAPRIGRKGRRFTCYKFRTMVPHADRAKDQLRSHNERKGAFFKMERDPRITRVGRWLRRYSLDELPQFWNVVRGEMSLVGPRPHPPDDVERYQREDLQRLDAVPGMTGLWQVTARKDPSFKRCVALDVEYISHWSLSLDFRVLRKTIAAVLHGSGA